MNISELMKRPYHVVLVRDEAADGQVGWVAGVAELPGCLSQGDTPGEAAEHIQDAMATWFEGAIEKGSTIPEPAQYEFPRMPRRGETASLTDGERAERAAQPLASLAGAGERRS